MMLMVSASDGLELVKSMNFNEINNFDLLVGMVGDDFAKLWEMIAKRKPGVKQVKVV